MKKRTFSMVMSIGLCFSLLTACSNVTVTSEAPAADTTEEAAPAEDTAATGTYAADNFEITIPAELADIVDVEVSADRIDVYHKESKDAGFGGLEYSVWAVAVPRVYAGGPYIKVGELSGEGESTYDVVRGEATEIQWDYNLPEMPADFQKIYDARDAVFASITGTNGYTYEAGAGTKGEDLYGDVLAKYVQAVNEGWDANKLEDEEMSPEFYYMGSSGGGLDNIGFAYDDVNCDGIDELFIGDMADDDSTTVYDVYTMVDRKPAHVISGTARDRYYDYENDFLANEWSGGAGSSGFDVYALMANSTELVFQFGYKYDEYEDEQKPWFKTYDQDTYESITEEEFNEGFAMSEKYVKLDYSPLSEFNGAAASDNEERSTGSKLPKYVYPGPELFYTVLYSYLIDEYGPNYPAADVTIPCPIIIAEDESNKDDIRVWGDFWVLKYDLNGDTLENTSGGSYPGCIHIKSTDEGYEVIGMDIVGDGSDFEPTAKKIFGKYYKDFIKSSADTEGREKFRAQIIADYVAENNLKITAYQDYGWDPVPLPEESTDSYYSILD